MLTPTSLLKQIEIQSLVPSVYQPRQQFTEIEIQALASTIISTGGLLQPIVVRPLINERYEIVAGERRWRAAKIAGLTTVSCLIANFNDEQTLQAAIIENVSRAQLNPIEEAMAYQRLIDEFSYHHDEIAVTVGKSRTQITNLIRLLRLDKRIQSMIQEGILSEGHGRTLIGLHGERQYELAKKCEEKQWSVRRVEQEVKKMKSDKISHTDIKPVPYNPNIKQLEAHLSGVLNTSVHIECHPDGGGYLKLRFHHLAQLEQYCRALDSSTDHHDRITKD